MQPFTIHTGIGVPLRRSNVDTDQILPAQFLKRISRDGFEDALFSSWRQREPDFVLNRSEFSRGSVLVAGSQFGSGSSREQAVWALMNYGFRAVVSPSFADIFSSNAGKSGLLTAVCDPSDVERLWDLLERAPGTSVTVDLTSMRVKSADLAYKFGCDEYTRWRMLHGLDDIEITLKRAAQIAAYEASRPSWMPSL